MGKGMTQTSKLADALNELLESFEKDGKFCKSSCIRNELYYRLKQTLEESKEAYAQPEPLFKELISKHDGLAEELAAIDSQPEQQPVAWGWIDSGKLIGALDYKRHPDYITPLYTHPPVPTAQPKPLTFEQVEDCFPEGPSVFEDAYGDNHTSPRWLHAFARAIEAAHGIKGDE